MRVLGATDLLELTERSAGQGPAGSALLALAVAYPEHPAEVIAATPLSARDRALLAVRARTLGAEMIALDRCDSCGEQLELALTAEAIGLAEGGEPFPPAPTGVLEQGDRTIAIRAVTAGDAAAAETSPDAAAARALIIERAAAGGRDGDDLEAALEALDRAADVGIELSCPACNATTRRAFDAAAFFRREIESRNRSILRGVADLARVYHWAEKDILDMPAGRRAFYLAEARGQAGP